MITHKRKKPVRFDILQQPSPLITPQPPENIKNLENISESPDFQKSPISEHSQDLINSDNVEIQLLKNPDKDIQIFEVFYENTEEYLKDVNSKIKEKIRKKEYHLAEQIYNSILKNQFQINIHLAISILNLYLKWEKFDVCLQHYENLPKTLKKNRYFYSVAIHLFAKLKRPEKGMELLEEMKEEKIKPDIYIFCNLIEGFLYVRNFNMCLMLYQKVIKKKWQKNAVFYNIMIDVSQKQKDLTQMLEFLNQMKLEHIPPDEITFGLLIQACTQEGQFETAWSLFFQMSQEKLKPNGHIFGHFLDGYAKANQFTKCEELFLQIETKYKMKQDAVCYGRMFDIFAKRDFNKTFNYFLEAKSRKIRVSPISYNVLISCCEYFGRYEQGLQLIIETRNKKFDMCVVYYSHVIRFFLKLQRYKKALSAFQEMEAKHIQKNTVIYGHFFLFFQQTRDYKHILEFHKKMGKENINLDQVWQHNIYLDALKYEKQFLAALEHFYQMPEKDEVSYCLFYDILCWAEDPCWLLENHEKAEEFSEFFSENTYNSMIQAFFRVNLFEQGMQAFWEMQERFGVLQNPLKTYLTMHKSLYIQHQEEYLTVIKSFFGKKYPEVDLNLYEIRSQTFFYQ